MTAAKGLAEAHRNAAIATLAEVIADVPGYEAQANDYAERIVDRIMAASVETWRDLVAAEESLKR